MSTESLLQDLRDELSDGGLVGSFLVRDLRSGREIGLDVDVVRPIASIVKVPLAIATLERIELGELDGAAVFEVAPGPMIVPGPVGISRFRRPVSLALDDLLYFSCALSDGTATDLLFDLTPPAEVGAWMRRLGLEGIAVRHRMRDLIETPVERFDPLEVHLAHSLAIDSGTAGSGHPVRQLDVSRANAASARHLADVLEALWTPSAVSPSVAGRVRELMGDNVNRQRLGPDFSSDTSTWSSKTGTLLNLRHEAGVVEYRNGDLFAVVALTESRVPAAVQPGAEALMAHVARVLTDHLR